MAQHYRSSLLIFLGIVCPLPLTALAGNEPPALTAAELARHLGVRTWKFGKDDLPERFLVQILDIKDGEISVGHLGWPAYSFEESGDLTIIISQQSGKSIISIAVNDQWMTAGPDPLLSFALDFQTAHSKPRINEPMVLVGRYAEKEGKITVTGKVSDVVSGVAVLIRPMKGKRNQLPPTP